jgi:hypothetical protein
VRKTQKYDIDYYSATSRGGENRRKKNQTPRSRTGIAGEEPWGLHYVFYHYLPKRVAACRRYQQVSWPSDPFTDFLRDLEQPISRVRLESYRQPGSSDLDVAVNYFWNIALCEALYPTLNALEVSLRNSVHAAASAIYGTPYWFDQANVLILDQPKAIREARRELEKRGKQATSGRIIAELSFGFWTYLLGRRYDRHFWKPNNYQMLRDTFPQMPRQNRTRTGAFQRYNELRELRNRVFHFEPVWNRTNLAQLHADILEAISWINPTLHRTVLLLDHFPYVHQNERSKIKQTLTNEFNPP